MRVISKLDIKDDILVKGINYEGLRKIGDPIVFAQNYYEQKIDEIIFIDPVASLYNKQINYDIIKNISKKLFIPKICGGGIKSIENIRKLLEVGADIVTINSGLIHKPSFISQAANTFGSSTIIASITMKKIKNEYYVFIDNGKINTGKKVLNWIKELQNKGAGQFLITSIDKDGTGEGFENEIIKKIHKISKIPIILSGGFGRIIHLKKIKKYCDAIAISSSFHKNFQLKKNTVKKKKTFEFYDLSINDKIDSCTVYSIKKSLNVKN